MQKQIIQQQNSWNQGPTSRLQKRSGPMHGQSSTSDYENIPTEGTFAPYSVQSITSIEQQVLERGPQKYQTINSKHSQKQTRQTTAVQSRQSSIHMPLAPTNNYMSSAANQARKPSNFKNATQVMMRSSGRTHAEQVHLRHEQTAKSSEAMSRRYATGSQGQSSAPTPKIGHGSQASSAAAKRQKLGSTGPAIVDDTSEQTMPRNNRENPKWLDMPLSMEDQSNRTHRSYFVVSGQQATTGQQPSQVQEKRQFKPNSTMGASTSTRRLEEPPTPIAFNKNEQNQFTSISDIPATMGDQRSTTPYLGNCLETNEVEDGQNEQELISTHQLLMMSASSIPAISNDADSQKQTTRSPLGHQRLMRGEFGDRKFSEQSRGVTNQTSGLSGYRTHQHRQHSKTLVTSNETLSTITDGALIRQAQNKTTNEFQRKLGNLKEALSTIKTNLSSFKQTASAKNLPPTSTREAPSEPEPISSNNNNGHTRNLAVSHAHAGSAVQLHPAAFHPSIAQSCYPSSRHGGSNTNLLQPFNGLPPVFCCQGNNFSRNEAVGADFRSRSHPNLGQNCNHDMGSCSCTPGGNHLSRSNSYNDAPRLSQNGEVQQQQQQLTSLRPSQTLNFSEIKHLQDEQQLSSQRKEVVPVPPIQQQQKPIEDSFAKMQANSSRNQSHQFQAPLDTSKTFKQCQEEATGKFVNPVSTQTKNYFEDSMRNDIMIPQLPSYHQSEQSGGETIEDVHRRHQNSLLLEEYSRRLKKQTQQHQQQSLSNIMRKTASSLEMIQPLELDKLDEKKSVPHFSTIDIAPQVHNNYNTIEQSIGQLERRRPRHDQVSNHMSCKHETVLSESKCQCCHTGMASTVVDNNRSHSTPPASQMCYTQRDDKNYDEVRWHERRVTDDHSTMIVHDSIQHPEQHARLMPQSIASSLGQTIVSPCAKDYTERAYEDEPMPRERTHLNRNSSKDQHPSVTPNQKQHQQQISRSVSSPIIIAAGRDINGNGFEMDNKTVEIYELNLNPGLNVSRHDEKGSEHTIRRVLSNERQPGKIVRKSATNNPTPKVVRQQSRDQTKKEQLNVDHDTYNQMRALKKQLDQVQAASKSELKTAGPDDARVLKDKESRNRYLWQELGEVHGQLEIARQETQVVQQKCDDQLSALARKEQLIKDLQVQVASLSTRLKDKGSHRQADIKQENKMVKDEAAKLRNLLKQAEQEKLQLKYDLSKSVGPKVLETQFLTELLKMIGADQAQGSFEYVLKKLKKQSAFVKKILKLVTQVEGRKTESLNDCLKWVKGLLKDFITLRKGVQDHNSSINQQPVERERHSHIAIRENSVDNGGTTQLRKSQLLLEDCLSPIGQNSHFSMHIDSSGFLKPAKGLPVNMTDTSFSPRQQHMKSSAATSAMMMNFSNANIHRQPSRGPSHESMRAGLPRGNSQESSQQAASAAVATQNIISKMSNSNDLNGSRKHLTQRQKAPEVGAKQQELRKNYTAEHFKMVTPVASQQARVTKESRHSSGNWTARCRPVPEAMRQQQANHTTQHSHEGINVMKSSHSRSRKRIPNEPPQSLEVISHYQTDYRAAIPQQQSTSSGLVTEESCGSLSKKTVTTSAHDQLSRRHIQRQNRQKKQPCQTNTSHITSSDQTKTLQTLQQNEGVESNRIGIEQADERAHLRLYNSFVVDTTSGTGTMTTQDGRKTAQLGASTSSRQQVVTPYEDVSIDMEHIGATMYNQVGAFKTSNVHSFQQAQAKLTNASGISSQNQYSHQSRSQVVPKEPFRQDSTASQDEYRTSTNQQNLKALENMQPSSCDTSAFINTAKRPVEEACFVTQSQQQLAGTQTSIRMTMEPNQMSASFPLSMQLYQRRSSKSGPEK